jgi:hypothetical protein
MLGASLNALRSVGTRASRVRRWAGALPTAAISASAAPLAAAPAAAAAAAPAAAAAAAAPLPASTAPSATAVAGLFGESFEVPQIHAVRRDTTGKRPAQWARMNGLLPGIV